MLQEVCKLLFYLFYPVNWQSTKENVNSMLNKYIEVPGSLYNLSAVQTIPKNQAEKTE